MFSTLSTGFSGSAAKGRRFAAGLFASLAVAGLSAGAAQAQSRDPTFQLVNQTGYTIHEVYVSHRSDGSWRHDVLGPHVLRNGSSILVNHLRPGSCTNDIRIVYSNGFEETQMGVNTCRIVQMRLLPGGVTRVVG